MTISAPAIVLLMLLTASAAEARKAAVSAPKGPAFLLKAIRRQEHGSLKGQCDYYVVSNISAGAGRRSVRLHGLLVAVTAWGQPFTVTNMPEKPNPKTVSGEKLTVVLTRTGASSRMRANYNDVVYERGKITLKFSGVVLLSRK